MTDFDALQKTFTVFSNDSFQENSCEEAVCEMVDHLSIQQELFLLIKAKISTG